MRNPWQRRGLYYVCRYNIYGAGGAKPLKLLGQVSKELHFISYHLIKWIHGEQKLIEMAKVTIV